MKGNGKHMRGYRLFKKDKFAILSYAFDACYETMQRSGNGDEFLLWWKRCFRLMDKRAKKEEFIEVLLDAYDAVGGEIDKYYGDKDFNKTIKRVLGVNGLRFAKE